MLKWKRNEELKDSNLIEIVRNSLHNRKRERKLDVILNHLLSPQPPKL